MKKVESTLSFENQMYRVGIPWKSDARALPDNYEMALKRLENTEKRLKSHQTLNRHTTSALSSTSRRVMSQKFKSRSGQCQGGTFHTSQY